MHESTKFKNEKEAVRRTKLRRVNEYYKKEFENSLIKNRINKSIIINSKMTEQKIRPNENNNNNSNNMSNEECIGPDDVLLGRGGGTNNHVGNKKFRSIVAEYQMKYIQARKPEKVTIANTIVSIINNNGGRFLQKPNLKSNSNSNISKDNNNIWIEVTSKRAQEKTSQALREGLDVRHFPTKDIKDNNYLQQHLKHNNNKKQSNSQRKPYTARQIIVKGKVVLPATTSSPPLPTTTSTLHKLVEKYSKQSSSNATNKQIQSYYTFDKDQMKEKYGV